MAYIAPSLWTVNHYGEGLRRLVRRTRQLDRWIDFKAHQIFDEAITYTAVQFFTKEPCAQVRIAIAPGGDAEAHDVDWSDGDLAVPYNAFAANGEWLMATGTERALIDRLARDCLRLDDQRLTSGITVGIQTSADSFYHLDRIGTNRYRCAPKGVPACEVEIEDAIMKPLISGGEAKRYEEPATDTYLLFPYARDPRGNMRLIPADEMEQRFPRAWQYLLSWEAELRAREGNKFDDDNWYRFGRHQNVDKQDIPKLIVAQTVPEMRVCADTSADKYLNNVRVNGIIAATGTDQSYLLGVLNGPISDFVFRRIGKPKQGGWFEANKQFIAPLPIPNVSPEDRAEIAARARELQRNWTRRRELLHSIEDRLSVLARARHPARWLWPDLQELPEMTAQAPAVLKLQGERRAWAEAQLNEFEASRLEALQAALDGGGRLEAAFREGELRLYVGGAIILDRIYLNDGAGRLAEAYWRWLFLSRKWREADRFAAELRRPPVESDSPATHQFVERIGELADDVNAIEAGEREMNERLFQLYALTADERLLVENDHMRRRDA
ncbi:hypothetical protein [Mesorhizobium sp. M0207]|uniref:hypothetical protein n=1 Tax=Mesorhizobium sp. M0207 TaxID=2956915 RepID=UPI00333BFFEE